MLMAFPAFTPFFFTAAALHAVTAAWRELTDRQLGGDPFRQRGKEEYRVLMPAKDRGSNHVRLSSPMHTGK